MDETKKNSIALMRYGIIAPVICHTIPDDMKLKEFLEMASKKEYSDSYGNTHTFSPGTIERWVYNYRKNGFDGLLPNSRKDCGQSRKVDEELAETIRKYKTEHPRMPATEIYRILSETGMISQKDLSLSTVTRCVNVVKAQDKNAFKDEFRRYERPHINEVWCGDSCVGPKITIDGCKRRIYIMALIDDASRFITAAIATYSDSFESLLSLLKTGILKYGIPSMLNFDNGKNYRNRQMELLAARLGTTLYYCRPYNPVQKSKIERWFRTLRDKWMATTDLSAFHSLDEIQSNLNAFVLKYNQTIHSSLNGNSPETRFFSESERIKRIPNTNADKIFLLEIERKVSVDCVITINNIEYEVDSVYANKRVKLRYTPDASQIYVVNTNGDFSPIKHLNKTDNAFVKRNKLYLSEGASE